jgi:hypothetical protein
LRSPPTRTCTSLRACRAQPPTRWTRYTGREFGYTVGFFAGPSDDAARGTARHCW